MGLWMYGFWGLHVLVGFALGLMSLRAQCILTGFRGLGLS